MIEIKFSATDFKQLKHGIEIFLAGLEPSDGTEISEIPPKKKGRPAKKTETTVAETPEMTTVTTSTEAPMPAVQTVTRDDAFNWLKKVNASVSITKAVEILETFKVKNFSSLPITKYAELIEACKTELGQQA